jgi:hypothetical protein
MNRNILVNDIGLKQPSAWAVRGVAGGLTVLWGRPGSYKTFLSISMAVAVAAGKPWFGCSTKQANVMYVLGEGGLDMFRRRVGEAARNIDVNVGDLPLWVRGEALDLSTPLKVKRFIREWGEDENIWPGLIVVDTLSRCMPGDENTQETMQGFVNAMDDLREYFEPCTVLVIHHASKQDTIRGSSVLPGAVDVSLHAEIREKVGVREMHLTADKLRDMDTDSFAHPIMLPTPIDVLDGNGAYMLDEFGDKINTIVIKDHPDHQQAVEMALTAFSLLKGGRTPGHWIGYEEWEREALTLDNMTKTRFKRALASIRAGSYGIESPEVGQYNYVQPSEINPFLAENQTRPGVNYGVPSGDAEV